MCAEKLPVASFSPLVFLSSFGVNLWIYRRKLVLPVLYKSAVSDSDNSFSGLFHNFEIFGRSFVGVYAVQSATAIFP